MRLSSETLSDPADWVDEHADYLYNCAYGQLRDRAEAEEIVKETFIAAISARNRFDNDLPERAALVNILRDKIRDHLRRKCGKWITTNRSSQNELSQFDQFMLWIHETAAECLCPSRRLELNEFRHSLETALHTLPRHVVQAFAMYESDEAALT